MIIQGIYRYTRNEKESGALTLAICSSIVLAIACAACIFSFAITVKLLISYLELKARSSKEDL